MSKRQTATNPEDRDHVHYTLPGRGLFSAQQELELLPVSDVERSVKMYAEALRPLLNSGEEERELDRLVAECLVSTSSIWQLQVKLMERAKIIGSNRTRFHQAQSSTDDGVHYPNCSWLEEWWDKYAYLSGSDPLPVNSNFFGTVEQDLLLLQSATTTTTADAEALQVATAACATRAVLRFWERYTDGSLAPDSLDGQGRFPLCSFQYTRIFASSRVPGASQDHFQSNPDADYIAVACDGHWFKLRVLDSTPRRRPLDTSQLLQGFRAIRALAASYARDGRRRPSSVGFLTARDRREWAAARTELWSRYGASFSDIEGALFNLSLGRAAPSGPREVMLASELGDLQLGDYYFDKSMTLFVFRNGVVGFGGEHGHADAPVPARVIFTMSLRLRVGDDNPTHWLDAAVTPLSVDELLDNPDVSSIDFEPSALLDGHVEAGRAALQRLADNNDLEVLFHERVTREQLKRLGVSPDSFFQMALQLAYYRDRGVFTATYETASTRAFFHGRTETIRPLSMDSVRWVKSMQDPSTPVASRLELLRKAVHTHVSYIRAASNGQGCDRHLMGLRLIAIENGLPLPEFLTSPLIARGTEFGLSTSNMTVDEGGVPGFGAPYPFSYGVCYNIGPKGIRANVTCNRAFKLNSASRFTKLIAEAIDEIFDMCSVAAGLTKPVSSKL